ncbi:MAG: hypothetical protein DMD79_17420 [Candidatus Rokuibacteriota bacterium]|nr:MAG: hypothetical protein DMD79_17420 [Candidatus Rokubacteria bacterium]
MLVAAVSVHVAKGFFATGGGYEYNLLIGAAAAALAFTGPGAWSLDAAPGLDLAGNTWGLAAVVAGLAGGLGALATRAAPRLAAAKS